MHWFKSQTKCQGQSKESEQRNGLVHNVFCTLYRVPLYCWWFRIIWNFFSLSTSLKMIQVSENNLSLLKNESSSLKSTLNQKWRLFTVNFWPRPDIRNSVQKTYIWNVSSFRSLYICIQSLKSCFHLSKNWFYLTQWKPFKNHE